MIELKQHSLPELSQIALVKHLSGEGHALLMTVIASKATTRLVEAMLPAMEAKDHEPKIDVANEALRASHRYQVCLDVLSELKNQKEPFTLAKVI